MMIVHSQKQLNGIVSIVKNNLEAQGVKVTRRQLEKALSPALSGGQSHEVLSAKLKSMPRSVQAVAKKSFTDNGMSHDMPKAFTNALDDLSRNAKAATCYGNQMSAYKPKLIKLFSSNEHELQCSELSDFFDVVKDAIEHGKRFDVFDLSTSHNDERDDEGYFAHYGSICLKVSIGGKELALSGVVDPDDNTLDGLDIDKSSFENVIDDSDALSSLLEGLLDTVGLNNTISNKFDTVFSVELLSMMIEETESRCDTALKNKEISDSHKDRYNQYLERYLQDSKWRDAWNSLMNNQELMSKKYRLQSQLEYIERKADLANNRVGKSIERMREIQRLIRE